MDREKFQDKLNKRTCHNHLDDETIDTVVDVVIDHTQPLSDTASTNKDRQLLIAMEELAELSQELSKQLRGKGNRVGILEEMADVAIATRYARRVLGITDEELNQAICVKLDEALDKIDFVSDHPNMIN